MTVVIDVGCARYGGDYSLERLAEEFQPDVIYGFDPNWDPDTMTVPEGVRTHVWGMAAWTFDGVENFHRDGLNSCITGRDDLDHVPCIDLAKFIVAVADDRLIVKLDAEGSEYPLLEHLIEHRVDALISLLWVEWHPKRLDADGTRRASIEQRLACEVREWRW